MTIISDAREDGQCVINLDSGAHVIVFVIDNNVSGGIQIDNEGQLDSYVNGGDCLKLIRESYDTSNSVLNSLGRYFRGSK